MAAAATSLLKKRGPRRWAPCVSRVLISNMNVESETGPRRSSVRPRPRPRGSRSRRTLRRRSPGTRNGRQDARGVGGNRTQRRRQMRRERAGGSSRGAGGRRAGTLGRAPTEQTVAGMLTHGHASTVSSSGMTELVLIRAHCRAAHSRLSLSSSTHIARIRRPIAFRPFGTGRSARHFCLLQRRSRAELLMPRGRQRSRRRPSVAPPLQSLERDGLQASDAVARREAALDLYRLDHLPLRRERLDGFRHLIGDDLAA